MMKISASVPYGMDAPVFMDNCEHV